MEGIRLLWAIAPAAFLYAWAVTIGPGAGTCFPLFLVRLWKTQREDYGRENRNNVEESRLLWAIVPAAFMYAWAVAIGPGTEIRFPLLLARLWKTQRERSPRMGQTGLKSLEQLSPESEKRPYTPYNGFDSIPFGIWNGIPSGYNRLQRGIVW